MSTRRWRANELSSGLFLIGMGVLFYTNFWWPGILFVLGLSSLAQSLVEGRSWYGCQGAIWMIGMGVAFTMRVNFVAAMFVILGLSTLVGAYARPPFAKPKPTVDNSLE